jgi:hypothetical protein
MRKGVVQKSRGWRAAGQENNEIVIKGIHAGGGVASGRIVHEQRDGSLWGREDEITGLGWEQSRYISGVYFLSETHWLGNKWL